MQFWTASALNLKANTDVHQTPTWTGRTRTSLSLYIFKSLNDVGGVSKSGEWPTEQDSQQDRTSQL